MLLADWKDGFDRPILDYVASRLASLGATEEAALYSRTDRTKPRALVATDLALFDCGYVELEGPRKPIPMEPGFEVRLIPWDDVPAPLVAFTASVGASGVATGTERMRLTLEVKPGFFNGEFLTADDFKAAQEFVRPLVHLRRQCSTKG